MLTVFMLERYCHISFTSNKIPCSQSWKGIWCHVSNVVHKPTKKNHRPRGQSKTLNTYLNAFLVLQSSITWEMERILAGRERNVTQTSCVMFKSFMLAWVELITQTILWLQHLWCEDFMLFSLLLHCKLNIFKFHL